jgi:hypothetical protein
MQEAFVLVKGNTMQDFELAMKTIEELHGRVLHGYPPNVIIVSLHSGTAGRLLDRSVIESVDIGEILDERLERGSNDIRMAIVTWNEHLRTQKEQVSRDDTSRGLSWGDPSRLPPDPPPHIQERLRRRERMMQRPSKIRKAKPGKNK